MIHHLHIRLDTTDEIGSLEWYYNELFVRWSDWLSCHGHTYRAFKMKLHWTNISSIYRMICDLNFDPTEMNASLLLHLGFRFRYSRQLDNFDAFHYVKQLIILSKPTSVSLLTVLLNLSIKSVSCDLNFDPTDMNASFPFCDWDAVLGSCSKMVLMRGFFDSITMASREKWRASLFFSRNWVCTTKCNNVTYCTQQSEFALKMFTKC